MLIEILSTNVEEKTVNGKNGPVQVRQQAAILVTSEQRIKFRIGLGARKPFPEGKFTLKESSFKVSNFGDLEIDRFNLDLEPVRAAAPSARAVG